MSIRTLWFDRLRNRLREKAGQAEMKAPSLFENTLISESGEILKELNAAQPLIISADVSRRIAPSSDASEDLKQAFSIPFDPVFIEFDPAVRLPGVRQGSVRAVLVSRLAGGNSRKVAKAIAEALGAHLEIYTCRVWMQRRGKVDLIPIMSFYFVPSKGWAGEITRSNGSFHIWANAAEHRQVMNFLIWLAGYVNSPHVLAVRHNRSYDLVRSYEGRGLLPPSSYYTFESERIRHPAKRRFRGKTTTIEVRGHFRRAHWHRLPTGGSAWFHTTWIRPHKRHVPIASEETVEKAA